MSDQNKPAQPAPQQAQPAAPPLENEQVHVTVEPKERHNRDHKEYSEKVKETIKEKVKKELRDNKGGGAKKQLDAAEKVADDAKRQVDPKKVDKVKIKVDGEVGGDKVSREKTVTPKEGS